jgi:dTDP-L-rhamnose 4-epimerase
VNPVNRKHVLITGGCGFIGSHLADELLQKGYAVRILDRLCTQVHGPAGDRPAYLNPGAEFVHGDIRDSSMLERALAGIDAVVHLAASVGVGQSMYRIAEYVETNDFGTALLLQNLIAHPVERLILASSMSIYGEGLYRDAAGTLYDRVDRSPAQLKTGDWEVRNSSGETLQPIPTPESKFPSLASIYALTKYSQERSCLLIGQAYGIPTTALRFFNAYGPRQALSNPYTGVLAIFAARFLNGNPPLIYEDGEQRRDFVSVYDVARSCRLAMETPEAAGQAINIGSGRAFAVAQVAEAMAKALGKEHISAHRTGKYRVGDIRHCFADISLAQSVLGFEPQVSFTEGLTELAAYLENQSAVDQVNEAAEELAARGLTV